MARLKGKSRSLLTVALTAVGLWTLPMACAGRPELTLGGPCETTLAGKCGGPCDGASDCSGGLYCGEKGSCTADCTSATVKANCGEGFRCSGDGRCVKTNDIGFGGAGTGGKGAGGENGECIDVKVDFKPQVPTVMLLIDQSGSMNEDGFGQAVKDAENAGDYDIWDCGDGDDDDGENDEYWRWNVVRNVLLNPDTGVVKPLEAKVRFGMALYTSENGWIDPDTNEKDPSMECPLLESVPIGLNRHSSMLDAFVCSDIRGDTPTGESLSAVAAQLKAFDEPGPKVIVVATDGEPDSCDCPNFGNDDPEECRNSGKPPGSRPSDLVKADVVARAKGIFENDEITVHVINVSSPSNASLAAHLQEVADAGGGKLFDGFDPGALKSAFNEIIDGVRSCKIDLDGKISAGKENTGVVKLDGEKLVFGDDDGWKKITESQIELVGAACKTIKSGDHDLDISFPCGTFIPITK